MTSVTKKMDLTDATITIYIYHFTKISLLLKGCSLTTTKTKEWFMYKTSS